MAVRWSSLPLPLKLGILSAPVGACVALSIFAYGTLMPEWLMLVACPFSLAAMALDSASRLEVLLGWLIICAANAALYMAAGVTIGSILSMRRGG
jgi:hypothetical protein